MIRQALATWLIARAKRTPYFHLHHADGSLYMERYWLVPSRAYEKEPDSRYSTLCKLHKRPFGWLLQRFGVSVRIHRLHTPDLDRHMHDHPWPFVSVVLRGFYVEARPRQIEPAFFGDVHTVESMQMRVRGTGSIAFRRATDRHSILSTSVGEVWTLFITFPKRQWWGFYTPSGKVHWKDYESVHNPYPITEEPT